MMTETQRAALMAAEDAFRRESDYCAMIGKETKARANMALAGQMAAALAEPEPAEEPFAYLQVNLPDVFMHNAGCTLWAGNPQNKTLFADNSMIAVYTRPQRREPQCKWPTCHSDEYQQQLADDVARDLIGPQLREPLTEKERQIDHS